jgi:hypothetical protein
MSITSEQVEGHMESSENLMDEDIDEKEGGDMRINTEKYINFPDPLERLVGFYAAGWT